MTFAVFHDYPGLEYGLPKFHDFPSPVVTLNSAATVSAARYHTMMYKGYWIGLSRV